MSFSTKMVALGMIACAMAVTAAWGMAVIITTDMTPITLPGQSHGGVPAEPADVEPADVEPADDVEPATTSSPPRVRRQRSRGDSRTSTTTASH